MNDSMREGSGDSFEEINLDDYGLPDVEHKAKSLKREILTVCKNINLLNGKNSSPDHDSRLHINELKARLLRLYSVLILFKKKLTQYIEAMERNVQRLEHQNLNTAEADIEIIRSIELASLEVKRLKLLLGEISELLSQSEELTAEPITPSFAPTLQRAPKLVNEKRDQKYDLDRIFNATENTRNIASEHSTALNPTNFGIDVSSPLLQDAPPSGLNNTLSKIPSPSPSQVKILTDPYDGGLYVQDGYFGRTNLNYDPFDLVAGSMALGSRYGNPILGEVGFDGRYNASTNEGAMIPFESDQLGNGGDI